MPKLLHRNYSVQIIENYSDEIRIIFIVSNEYFIEIGLNYRELTVHL
jgi:hypothetical protein